MEIPPDPAYCPPPPGSSDGTLTPSQLDLRRAAVLARPVIWRLSSLDNMLEHRKAHASHKRLSSRSLPATLVGLETPEILPERIYDEIQEPEHKLFRGRLAELGFCFSMAVTQLVAEYLITGFSEVFSVLMSQYNDTHSPPFWPASILSIIVGSTILVFARAADLHGGYPWFMFGTAWLCIWTLVAGFAKSVVLLNVCRAMQGLAIAAFTPSSFTLFGSIYPNGTRKNLALGIYSASAPLGFYAGICTSASLPKEQIAWYFWIPSILAFITLIVSYLSIPSDRHDRPSLDLKMDWTGAFTITAGFVLVAYALAAGADSQNHKQWATPAILIPFCIGILCLAFAVYIEGWYASCPLLPFDFFRPRAVKPFAIACLFFYGCFGTWLFTTTSFLMDSYSTTGIKLAAWFTPLAAGGFFISVAGSTILHIFPITIMLLLSGLAWIAAPLLLALSDPAAGYWAFPFPSMLCGTLGIDMTFLISIIFLSSVQPLKYQGLAGALASILVNLGISFSLALSQIAGEAASAHDMTDTNQRSMEKANRAQFWFAVGSAGVGFIICAVFVRISRAVLDDEKESHPPAQGVALGSV